MIRINLVAPERTTKAKAKGGRPCRRRAPSRATCCWPSSPAAPSCCAPAPGGCSPTSSGTSTPGSRPTRSGRRTSQAIKEQVDEFQQKKAMLENKVLVIEQLRLAQKSPVHMLDEISKALPDYVWLTAPRREPRAALRFTGPEQQPGRGGRLHQRPPAQRLVPAGGPRLEPGGSEPRELHPDGHLQGPGGRGQGKGAPRKRRPRRPPPRRGQGRPGGRSRGGRRWPTIPSPSSPSPASSASPRVIAALICGGFYYFWYSDALETQKKKEARLAELQKQIRALEATANKLPEFQREVQALEARLETLKRILPPEKEMPDLMRRVQYLAAQSSLNIRKFNPAAVVPEGVLPGGPDQPRPGGHLPQPGRVPRPGEPDVAAREHGQRQDQGPGEADDQQHDRGLRGGHDLRLPGRAAAARRPEGQAASARERSDEGASP